LFIFNLIQFLSIKKVCAGSGTFVDSEQCSLISLDSEEEDVIRSSPGLTDHVCTEVLTIEESSDRSLLSGLTPKGKSVSEVSGGLSCWYTNAGALHSKMGDFESECINTDYDVRFVSETWFNDQSVVNIEGYDCFRKDRKSDTHGGGVCIYTRRSDSLIFRETNYDQLNSSGVEQVWCVVDTGIESILLGCIYRPKIIHLRGVVASIEVHKKRDGEINKSITFANDLVKKGIVQGLIIAGDFNFTELSWNELLEPEVLFETDSSDCFLDTLNECFLTQNVFFKTYQEFSKLTNLLDLVITESKERVYELQSGPALGGKNHGHLCLSWKYGLKKSILNSFEDKFRQTNYNFKKGNYGGMRSFFGNINWFEIFDGKNIGDSYKLFLEIYEKACEDFIPKIKLKKKRKTKPPWLTRELREMMRQKINLWHAFVSSGRKEELYEKYRLQCKLVKSSMSSSISKFELELAANSSKNPKGLFTYIKNKQQVKESIMSLNNSSGNITTDRAEIAEILNDQFESVFSVDDGTEPVFENRTEFVCDEEEIINRTEILNRLKKLDCNKAPGGDKIPQYVLKNCSEELSGALEIIFSRSLIEGEIPDEWREANITPLFKKGSKLKASNYRPVSLTSVCCKLMEGIMRDRITNHLKKRKLISPSQHGFVHRKSCVTNLLECQQVVSGLLNENKSVDVLYTDFEKAFDKVSHKKLIIKLYAYGIRGKLLDWIKSFLRGRRQRVVMGEIISDWRDILSGVPQGSVLGPLLFVIYINDLPDGLKNVFKMYADDSKVIAEVGEEGQGSELQGDIDKIKEWCDKWSMCLNGSKCKIMHFGNKNPCLEYYIENGSEKLVLGVTEEERDLGVIIAKNCKNNRQAEKSINQANYALGRMRKTFKFFNFKLFNIVYPTYIRPYLEFATPVWNNLSEKHIKKIESIQRRATKMVIEIRTLKYEDRLRELGLTTLELRRKRGDLIQVYKIINGFDEVDIDMGTGHNLRGGGDFLNRRHGHQIEREKTGINTMRNNSLPNRSATTWNTLPSGVVKSDTVDIFKEKIDEHTRSASWRRSIYSF
jgi:hypothetical protein